MEPRKKDIMDYVIPLIVSAIILFLAMQMAVSYDAAEQQRITVREYIDANGQAVSKTKFNFAAFWDDFTDRMENHLTEIKFVGSTPKFLLVAGFICLMGVGYVYTSRRKFINNKEYGTSEWGTAKQLSHLLAANLKTAEIRRIKKKKIKKAEKKREIAQAQQKYSESSNIIFTQTEKICMYNYELNNNTLIIGGSGSGKTRGYVLPNILQCAENQYSPSIVVTDPKGEILAKIGHYLTSQGYVLKVLNLKEQNRSFCFNPFHYILQERYEEQISTIVSSIMDSRSENKEQKSNDPFWDDMAKVLLKSIFYAVYEGYPSEQRNMSTVMEMFRWFEVSDNDDRYRNPTKLDRFFEVFGDKDGVLDTIESIIAALDTQVPAENGRGQRLAELTGLQVDKRQMMESLAIPIGGHPNGEIQRYRSVLVEAATYYTADTIRNAVMKIDAYINARCTCYEKQGKPIGVELFEAYGDVNNNPALRNWEDFRTKCKGKTAQSVTATALAKMAPFDEEQIRRIFSRDEMELDLVGERRTALFIVLPPTNKTYNFIANVLYTMLFEQLEFCATVKHNQSLPVPVRFICDEFYNTGRIPNFENILSYARSFGIGISIILQSLDQIKEMYEKSWGTVLDNCSTFLYLGGIRHADTLEYISKLLGKGTFDKKTYSRTKGRQSSSSTSYDKIGRELLDPSEIQRMNKGKCLLFVSGYQPYMSRKFNYTKHKNYKFTSDGNKRYLYRYETPKEAEEKQERAVQYNRQKEEGQEIEKVLTEANHQEREKTPHIAGDYDAGKTIKKMEENVLFLEFNNGEESCIADTEDEELDFVTALIEEEQREKETLRNAVAEHVKTVHIEGNTDVKEVTRKVLSMVAKGEEIAFSSDEMPVGQADMEILQEIESEEYEEVTNEELDLEAIKDGMSEIVNQLRDMLNDFDMGQLPEMEG